MSVSAISSSTPALYQPQAKPATQLKTASDGDSAAVEATESASTRRAEKQGGGIAAKPTGGINLLV